MRDEKFYKEYPEEWSDISFEVVDKSLVNVFEKLVRLRFFKVLKIN